MLTEIHPLTQRHLAVSVLPIHHASRTCAPSYCSASCHAVAVGQTICCRGIPPCLFLPLVPASNPVDPFANFDAEMSRRSFINACPGLFPTSLLFFHMY
ncbi:unnamed protein product [Periconia digitata]|uniref:Uncharacterized protein n=1 Tax=Periconia digitata TaxID=1303443 RepID=A0A9W4USW6_9PLEO|nr:unnamed protein product [Periconia digitata]